MLYPGDRIRHALSSMKCFYVVSGEKIGIFSSLSSESILIDIFVILSAIGALGTVQGGFNKIYRYASALAKYNINQTKAAIVLLKIV